ncbi:MAG TPA: hypothetical protein VMV31_08410 [Terriglobales bacterium]|nr:hypothetical protein [Terriglobales bacterium]
MTQWQRCEGAAAGLDLTILLDDDASQLASRLQDLKDFIGALPATTDVAVGYLHTGAVQVAQNFTFNHALAASKLRAPTGDPNSSPSPFGSLRWLLQRWPAQPGRRHEMILLSDGEEHIGGNNGNNVALVQALGTAVQAGVVVYTIYVTGAAEDTSIPSELGSGGAYGGGDLAGMPGATMGKIVNVPTAMADTNQGLANLGTLAHFTGGQDYAQGSSTPTRLKPFLDDIAVRLQSQYRLALTPAPATRPGLAAIQIQLQHADGARVTAPQRIFVGRP